ncbi:MAG: molecular chaperone HtpG, partial [Candidatus Omnitrophica bacterium]|nr:molecular chaperone HtpG [Candidatus Omnitrophota bacterium]
KIVSLLRYESSLQEKGELTSLEDYIARMKQEQKDIYYLSGESRQTLLNNPNLEYFSKNGIEVLLLIDPVDIFTFPSIGEYKGKTIKSADNADIDLKPEEKIEKPKDALSQGLISLFKEALKEKVADVIVSKRLVSSAATLVATKDSPDAQMEKIMKAMDKNFTASKKIMEINTEHPLIRNLSKIYMQDSNSPLLKTCILQLYEGSLLIEGNLSSPADFIKRMSDIMQEATK